MSLRLLALASYFLILSRSFSAAAASVTSDMIVFINCDIVVNASFTAGVSAAFSSSASARVLAIGRRTNVHRSGSTALYTPWAIDYFAYSRAAFPAVVPPFAIGRAV